MEVFSFNWLIFSENNWERAALAKLVEGFRWKVSGLDVSDLGADEGSYPKPDALIVILSSTDRDAEYLSRIVKQQPNTPIVVCIHEMADDDCEFELPVNVKAVITPEMSEATIQSLLLLVADGHRVVSSEAEQRYHMLDEPSDNSQNHCSANEIDSLTRRETEISSEISKGMSNKEIARKLNIRVNTVNVHVSSIRQKLGVKNRTMIALKVAGGVHRLQLKKKFKPKPAIYSNIPNGPDSKLIN
ncbi:response regulator transcription factor [uncultured Sulfitobacter sp.]|uniref:helix-turn-helix transcriptional regulator n=1 Tax=uncultured Sulfitobacter sp. TaxID=191468 RepID=UPI0030D90813|tara:strand:- start:37486 stop:38217 length:732 start_codon:yes stop_codon:yes gene_type:complete